jgi:hypothetical protein
MRAGVCVAGSALALSPVVLTACGSSRAALSPDLVARAATKTLEQPSEHMRIYATITANGQVSTVNASGDFRNTPVRGRMKVDAAAIGWGDVTMDEIVSGSTAYLSSDGFFGEVPPGIQWMSVDYAKASGVSTASASSQTPAQSLAPLKAAGAAKKVGDETLDGVRTTHYDVTIDPAKLPARLVEAVHPTYQPVDVWIDRQGLVRREMIVFSETVDGSRVAASMKIDLSHFGEAVSVKTPARADSFDATERHLNAILNGGS